MMERRTPEEIGAKMDALGLWELLQPYNFAVKPRGTALAYFCSVILGDGKPVKIRFLMLEGWQTLHDYVRTRLDANFGYYLSPMEMPHLELVILASGEAKIFRHDPGFMPREANDAQRELAARILWETYGILLRVESDRTLPISFVKDKAMFARVETGPDRWEDRPLVIPDPAVLPERVSFPKTDVRAAQDLPFDAGLVADIDFRVVVGLMTREPRPRSIYALVAVDGKTGGLLFDTRVTMGSDAGLKGMWESMPAQALKEFVRFGRIPGEIRTPSGRVFRLLRHLCIELPFKLSLHDSLPGLDSRFLTNV